MSAYWYTQFTNNDLYNGIGNNMMVNLNENIMYYGCEYGAHTRHAIKELNTYWDTYEAPIYVVGYLPTTFGVLCAADFNMGKYMVMSRASGAQGKFVGLELLSEYNAETDTPSIASQKTFNQMLSSGSTDNTYTHIFSKNQLPGLVAYIYDYPLFINGRYYNNPIGSQMLMFDPNTTTQIYLEANSMTGDIEVNTSSAVYEDTYTRIRIAEIKTNDAGIENITYFKINGFDPGRTLDQSTQFNPVSTFNGTTLAEASASNTFLKVVVGGKEYGLLLWELPV